SFGSLRRPTSYGDGLYKNGETTFSMTEYAYFGPDLNEVHFPKKYGFNLEASDISPNSWNFGFPPSKYNDTIYLRTQHTFVVDYVKLRKSFITFMANSLPDLTHEEITALVINEFNRIGIPNVNACKCI